jgi:hypothetical protein
MGAKKRGETVAKGVAPLERLRCKKGDSAAHPLSIKMARMIKKLYRKKQGLNGVNRNFVKVVNLPIIDAL